MTSWQIDSTGPVVAPGQLHGALDAVRAGAAHVLDCGDYYDMIYWGSDADGHHHILRAQAPVSDPNAWKPIGPLLARQADTEHNYLGPSFPFLLPVDERYWLLYVGCWGRDRQDGKLHNSIAVAISEDGGETWRYHDRHPPIAGDRDYDREATGSLWVLHEEGKFRMWYTCIGHYYDRPENAECGHGDRIPNIGIAYAESDDGLVWTKPLPDRVVNPREFGVDPYEYICSKPAMIKTDEGYTLWVNTFGTAYRVHRLTSVDGLTWTWAPRVGPDGELGTGAPGAFDDRQRSYPTMVRHGAELRCWFTGNGFGCSGMGYAVGVEE